MCGIAGFFKPNGLDDRSRRRLQSMVEILRHRGPDGDSHHLDKERGVALGHARLSIIGIHSGTQPIPARDERCILACNGEFYDYKRLRSRLMTRGDRFSTRSDSEIALPLYERLGLDFVEHLRGEFAFALYDRKLDRLILVRDRFGIRPLFWHQNDQGLYFASEVKGLLINPEVPRKLDRRAALNQLMHTMVPGTSAFDGIHALEPGCMLIATRRNGRIDINIQRYWDLDFPEAGGHDDASDEEQVDAVRRELVDSVTFRLEADVPVGCYLSGGIDSCSILGMASGAQQSPVKAFTISFDNEDYDEAAIAKEMADEVNADQDLICLGADELYGDNYVRTAWHAERTFYNTLGVAKWCMSRHVQRAGYKTVITGEGADELFGGYPALKRDMFLHGLDDEPPETRAAYEEALHKSNEVFRGAILAETERSHDAWNDLMGFTPSWLQPWMGTLELARPLLSDATQEELAGYDPVAAIAEKVDPDRLRGRHALDKAQYSWSKTMLEGQILNWGGDRVDMANSMESRPAFLDHHVAELATRIPPRLRIRGNIEKWVLREAMRGVLPEVLYKREKFAFMAPPAHTDSAKKARVQSLLDEYADPASIAEAGLLSPERTTRFIEEWQQ
ncbi:MAG: asparagine synthase (glutamine-hydrolyzing), partial [Xanthomonadales bacterium]|nr:asparagine synthase (glutamine-hydrolyzing) [Xanthomonadales bacterium]